MITSLTDNVNEEFVRVLIFKYDVNAVLGNVLPALDHRLTRTIAENFKPQLRPTDECTQRNGDGQSDHACTGDAHPHGVLQDISTQPQFNVFRSRT